MFSVIIPAYNEEKFLPKLLRSIKSQKLKPGEVIVANADSSDRTREIAIDFGCEVVRGGRISVGRNAGARVAKEDILVFMDADTVIPNSVFFNKILGKFLSKGADVASCYFIPAEKRVKYTLPMVGVNAFKYITHKLRRNVLFGGAVIVTTKKAFSKLEGFNEDMKVHEDSDFFKRAINNKMKFILIPQFIKISTRRYEEKKLRNIVLLGLFGTALGLIGGSWLKKRVKRADDKFWSNVK